MCFFSRFFLYNIAASRRLFYVFNRFNINSFSLAYIPEMADCLTQIQEKKNITNFTKPNSLEGSDDEQELKKGKKGKLLLKTPKGMRDFAAQQMIIREKVFTLITDCFKKHGATALDTPVCELRETLMEKYGEDSKLIYDLADQGGEILSLRYDLTVPFARYLAQNKLTTMKRYQIAKVYRRDQPAISKGRYREFYQCDFDIAGNSDPMISDSECLKIVVEVLNALDIKSYLIKVNHRELLKGIFEISGVPENKYKTTCSSIDKLGKNTWEEIKTELCQEKNLDETIVDKIGLLIKYRGSEEMLEEISKVELGQNVHAKFGIESLKLLNKYCKLYGIDNFIEYDLSLARGLDYYTGIIFEAILLHEYVDIGSIAAGGRYDDLVQSLSDKKKLKVPCVGLSIGIERIFSIIEQRTKNVPYSCECYVISIGKGLVEERMKIINALWNANIRSEHSYKSNPKILDQIQYCEEKNIPFALIIGGDELKEGIVKIREISTRNEIQVKRDIVLQELQKRLDSMNSNLIRD